MFNRVISIHGIKKPGFAFLPVIFFLGLISLVVVLEPSGTVVADAGLPKPNDADNDCLPDVFELIYGTEMYDPDSDSDGFPDGIEYTMNSKPMDPYTFPILKPGLRLAMYVENNTAKLCFLFFPGMLSGIEQFIFSVAYGQINGDSIEDIEIAELTPLIPFLITEATTCSYQGIVLSCVVIDIPVELLVQYAPMSFGCASKFQIDANIYADVIDTHEIDGVPVQHAMFYGIGIDSSTKYFMALVPEPPSSWDSDQVCKTEMELVESRDGVNTFEVTSAACGYAEDQSCSSGNCGELTGGEVISIDPAYLKSKISE